MSQVKVEIGKTDGYGYIGVQPPLSELTEEEQAALGGVHFHNVEAKGRVQSYSEHGFSGTGSESIKEKVVEIGRDVTNRLVAVGAEVRFDTTIYSLVWGGKMFSDEKDRPPELLVFRFHSLRC